MSSNMRSDCRKFAPNIFNKSKCTNCFRQKEEHSAEALESNRATRKVSKCGYLFVAPGWDFSNPLNRTKRWQRRWFVLYDDGELSYSVDEHPDTVPQASIDMNKVVEVSDAEEMTGNAHSLSVQAADRVHFVKATCREEYRWWADVLAVFPRSKGRHKRNATFPGVQPLSTVQQSTPPRTTPSSESRPRFNSCLSEPRKPTPPWSPDDAGSIVLTRAATPPPPTPPAVVAVVTAVAVEPKAATPTPSDAYRDLPASSNSPPTRDKIHPDDKSRSRRVANRERRGVKTGRSFSEDFAGMLPAWRDRKSTPTPQDAPSDATPTPTPTSRIIFDEYAESRREEKLKEIADSLTRPRYRRHTQTRAGAYTVRATRDGDNSEDERKGFGRPASPANLRGSDQLDAGDGDGGDVGDKPVRGDPDGCGLDINMQRYSPSSERRVELPAEDLLDMKKGWLMKQAPSQEWVKHWFVLRGAALMYYRDPTAEDKGIMDGVIDLSGVSSVAEVLVARNYGFQTLLWDERRYVLSAVTAGIRGNWMAAIRKAAGLKEPLVEPTSPSPSPSPSTILLADKTATPLSVSCGEREPSVASSTPLTPRSIHFSSDEEYRTASEGGRRESQDWGEPLTALPPSPPLNRTPISRVKEKARTRTTNKAGVYKRSKSSPPTSRRSTIDSVVPDDLILTSCGELPESEADDVDSSKSSILTIESCPSEISELKLQLNVALREVSEAEQERLKLRHCRGEVVGLEKQVKLLLGTIEQTEVQLAKKTKEVEEIESLRKRYNKLLKDHEEILSQWRQQTMEEDWKDLYKQIQERYRSDADAWQHKLGEADALAEEATSRYETLARELAAERGSIEHLHFEVISLSERLAQGIEENDSLYRRVRELEGRGSRNSLSISRERGRSVDSLSDLTNIDLDLNLDDMDKERIAEEYEDLRGRFEKAVQEIRAMKRELRESHALYDELELSCISSRQDAQGQALNQEAQSALMVARVDDLTLKLSAAEKQVRGLKQKMAKSDSRDKRRSLSLKGRESFQIGKELEEKLAELEGKIGALETGALVPNSERLKSPRASRSESPQTLEKEKKSLKASRLRRKSLDSATSSEPMKVLIRLSSLEAKVAKAAERAKQGCAMESGKTTSPSCVPRTKKHLQPVEVNINRASEDREGSLELHDMDNVGEMTETAQCVVSRLESLLKAKLVELSDRRKSLQESGLFDKGARMRLLAEKLAYESVLVSKIAQAVAASSQDSESFRNIVVEGEIIESCRLINLLKSGLNGEDIREANEPCETATEHLTRLLTERLVLVHQQIASSSAESCVKSANSRVSPEQLEFILQKQHELDEYIKDYRLTKLDQLARALALETLSLTSDSDGRSLSPSDQQAPRSIEDRRIREAWAMAQETVNRELIQAEISHVIMRCGQNYEASLELEQKTNFSLLGSQRLMLEQWIDSVEQILQQEMEAGIEALTVHYEHYLAKLTIEKLRPTAYSEEDVRESRKLLAEFADISAQKALIDARISVIFQQVGPSSNIPPNRSQTNSDFMSQLIENESDILRLSSTASENISDSEFQILFNQFSRTCLSSIAPDSPTKPSDAADTDASILAVTAALSQVQAELLALQNFVSKEFSVPSLHHETDIVEDASQVTTWRSVCIKCSVLCQQISSITNCLLEGLECQRCSQLQDAIHALGDEHEAELRQLRECQQHEMASLHGDLEQQRHSLVSRHEEEQAQLKERARKLERRLGTLDSEYMQQVDNLRDAYHKTLAAGLDRSVDGEENIRQRYQAEIEQLKALCEKGLAAMESSHRRIITEMEEKHRQELEQSRLEKEQALAEETQATLAALDAMRKAHETEVQKEIAKFKSAFVRKMHSAQDVSALQKDQEAEMAEIKEEILSLSEKYSVKCVESASFEDQLGAVSKKLADAQQHILQLDSRNKQLRAHLANEASELATADAAQLLRTKSRQLEQKCEEYGQLQKKLGAVSNHGEELSALCSRLRDEYLYAERCCTDNPVLLAKLWDKVQQLATTWPLTSKGTKIGASYRPRSEGASPNHSPKNKQFKEPSALSSAELIWSPKGSCSRSASPFLVSPLRSPSPCPLSGMVAERKKIFEP